MRVRVLGSARGRRPPAVELRLRELRARARRRPGGAAAHAALARASPPTACAGRSLNASPDVRDQLARAPGAAPAAGHARRAARHDRRSRTPTRPRARPARAARGAARTGSSRRRWVRDALLEHNAAFRLLEPAWSAATLDAAGLPRPRRARSRRGSSRCPARCRAGCATLASATRPRRRSGLRITDRAQRARGSCSRRACASLDSGTSAELAAADLRFVDGTFCRAATSCARLRPGAPDAIAMGHVPIDGPRRQPARALAGLPGPHVLRPHEQHEPRARRRLAREARARCARAGRRDRGRTGLELEL